MVCEDCQKNLQKIITQPKESKDSKPKRTNKLLESKKYTPYSSKCTDKDCKKMIQNGAKFCPGCSFKKGVCSQCGKKMIDTKIYKENKNK